MPAAHVASWGSAPSYTTSGPDLPPPSPSQLQLKVLAIGVTHLVRGRAARLHPSAKDATLPFDPSVDGVAMDEETGDMYYVVPMAGARLLADKVNVERAHLLKLEEGTDPVAVAALVNPVSSSWMALRRRVIGGCQGATVLVLGATSTSGRAAVSVARSLGAARLVGMSRSEEKLATVEELDARIVLGADPAPLPQEVGPVDIVLDFVGGRAAVGLLASATVGPGKELQYIHIGDLAGEPEISIPARLLNSKAIRITGSGMGAWSKMDMKKEIGGLLAAVSKMQRPLDAVTAPLAEVAEVWEDQEVKTKRLVLVP
ncbi:hypothetical protein MKZ38_006423 [Zalerion maritima]|uniref:Alcohol dehydrogenase-like C-terminal domain-containing protein n=1 Tax=Zalerion maritima TaxID=339359 RepID=A0AAD5RJH1_9PEZI|nr:hypothetical protein MKZ38_006423 [Zalerion maritima]